MTARPLRAALGLWTVAVLAAYAPSAFREAGDGAGLWTALRARPDPDPGVAAAAAARALPVALAFALALLAAGRAGRRWCAGGSRASRRDWLAWDLTAGLGLGGLAAAGAALAGVLFPVVGGTAVAAGVGAAFGPGIPRRRARPARPRHAPWTPLGVLAGVAVAGLWLGRLAPETGIDVLHYHLGRSAVWAATGRMVPNPLNFAFAFPALWEALVTVPLQLGGEAAAGVLVPALALLLAFHLRGALQGSAPRGGRLAAGLLLTSFLLGEHAATLKNDLPLAVFGFAACCAALRARRSRGARWALAAGILAGFGLGTKFTGLLSAALAAGLLAAPGGARRRSAGRQAAVFAAAAVVAVAPWLLRSLLETGNPFAPLASAWFGGGLDAHGRDLMRREAWGYLRGTYASPADKLRAAWTLATLDPVSCLPALAVPAAVLLLGTRARAWGAAALAGVGLWSLGPPQSRFLLQLLPVLCGVIELAYVPAAGGRAGRRLLPALLVLAAGLDTVRGFTPGESDRLARIAVTAGAVSPARFRAASLSSYAEAIAAADRLIPAGGRALFFADLRGAPLDRRALVASQAEPAPFLRWSAQARDEAALARRIRQAGITHVFYNRTRAVYNRATLAEDLPPARALRLWARYWRGHAALAWQSEHTSAREGAFALFTLARRGHPARDPVYLPGVEGWLWLPERLFDAGQVAAADRAFAPVREAAWDVAFVRQAWATIFGARLPAAESRAVLEGAAAAGVRSVFLYDTLARMAEAAGDDAAARRWRDRSRALDPGAAPPP